MAELHQESPHVDIAGYALDLLTVDERRDFENHLEACAECRGELETATSAAGLLRLAADPVVLPDGLEDRVFDAISASASAGPRRSAPVLDIRRAPSWRRRPRAWALGIAAAAAAIAVGVTVGHQLTSSGGPAPYATVTLRGSQPGSQAQGTARLYRTSTGTTIELTVQGLIPPPAGKFYTCWLVADDDTLQHQDRVSVGSFTVPDSGSVTVRWETAADLGKYPHLGVTLEPDNGDPLHQGPKVLTASA